MDPQIPLAVSILLACLLVGWLTVRSGVNVRNLWAFLLVAVTALQVARLYAGV